jgi:hypothetical protein
MKDLKSRREIPSRLTALVGKNLALREHYHLLVVTGSLQNNKDHICIKLSPEPACPMPPLK